MSLNTLRVLLVDADARKSEIISSRLAVANYTVLPASGLEEAADALCNQKFDAVVLSSVLPADGVADFTGRLRSLEMSQRTSSRTPILSISSDQCNGCAWAPSEDAGVDGYLSDHFDAKVLMDAVTRVASKASAARNLEGSVSPNLPIFEPEKFKAQVAYDRDLLIEIIDLFLSEQLIQIAEMQQALINREYDRLYLTAHTIKGSLASLHAAVGRLRAEELESAAKDHNQQHCEQLLSVLKSDLQTLEPALLHLRESSRLVEQQPS